VARPSIDSLFDHDVRVWRPTKERSTLGVEERTYQVHIAEARCKVNRPTAPSSDTGPGMAPTGARRLYMRPDVDVQARDLVELTAGPDAGSFWEVDQLPSRPMGHHTQLDCIAWNGVTPTEES